MTKQEMEEKFQSGKSLILQRKDDPLVPLLNELFNEGKIKAELVQVDWQSSYIRYWWNDGSQLVDPQHPFESISPLI